MSLNIKNRDAHKLAQTLAGMTGESMAAAVTEAIRERLERLHKEESVSLSAQLLAIGRDCAKHLNEPYLTQSHDDLLYGEDGLPK